MTEVTEVGIQSVGSVVSNPAKSLFIAGQAGRPSANPFPLNLPIAAPELGGRSSLETSPQLASP